MSFRILYFKTDRICESSVTMQLDWELGYPLSAVLEKVEFLSFCNLYFKTDRICESSVTM